jgi:hypothetical protein
MSTKSMKRLTPYLLAWVVAALFGCDSSPVTGTAPEPNLGPGATHPSGGPAEGKAPPKAATAK